MADADQTVLIVEDDQPTRELYERELGARYRILACASEREAIDALRMHPVDAVILEPSLPGGQGWHLLSSIRSTPSMQAIPIILCSTLNAQRQAMALGATRYLVKPVLPAALLETLRQLMPLG